MSTLGNLSVFAAFPLLWWLCTNSVSLSHLQTFGITEKREIYTSLCNSAFVPECFCLSLFLAPVCVWLLLLSVILYECCQGSQSVWFDTKWFTVWVILCHSLICSKDEPLLTYRSDFCVVIWLHHWTIFVIDWLF